MLFKKIIIFTLFLLCASFCAYSSNASDSLSVTGLPLPRFVSLSESQTNVRAGPGKQYPVKWLLTHKDMPVEVILEFEHWRKIRDYDGQEGWVYRTLLASKRTAVVIGSEKVPAYEEKPKDLKKLPRLSLYLEPKVVVNLRSCEGDFCYVWASGYFGWVARNSLWGVYEHENID